MCVNACAKLMEYSLGKANILTEQGEYEMNSCHWLKTFHPNN